MRAAVWRVASVVGAAAVVWGLAPRAAQHFEDAEHAYSSPVLASDDAGRGLLLSLGHDGARDQLFAWAGEPGRDWGERVTVASAEGLLGPRAAALPGGGFVACWSARVAGDWEVFAALDTGRGFGAAERLSSRAGADTCPALAVAPDGTIRVAWQGVDGARTDLFVAKRGAEAWDTRRVTNEPTSDISPSLAIDAAGTAWITWSSWRHGAYADGNYEVYVQRLDGSAEPQRVSDSSAADLAPTLVALGSELALVWTESYFPTRRNGVLTTVGYDRWADKVYRVARSKDGVFGPSLELRLTDNSKQGTTVSDRAFPIADPDGEHLWVLYGELAGDLRANFQTRVTVVGPTGAAEPRGARVGAFGPARELGLAWRGDELWCAQVTHAGGGGESVRTRLDVARVEARADADAQPLRPRPATPRKAPVQGLFADQPRRSERATREIRGRSMTAWFGNLHLHSDLSRDARGFEGSPAMNFQLVYDLGELDFAGLSDHAEAMLPGDWWEVRKLSDLWNRPGVFVTLPGYEWTSLSYGHRNVFFPDTQQADAQATFGALGPDGERTPEALWNHLGERRALTIPHHLSHALSEPTDWSFRSDRFQRLVEVFQVRGNYEFDGAPYQKRDTQAEFKPGHSLRAALECGQRLGVIASPDHGGGMGLAGAWSESLTRASIFEALYARRTFGTTGAKMDLFLEVAGTAMGSTAMLLNDGPVRVKAVVHGTVPGLELVLVRDGVEIKSWTTEESALEIDWTDDVPGPATPYYYLRAEQSDGHLGWTSPVWLATEY